MGYRTKTTIIFAMVLLSCAFAQTDSTKKASPIETETAQERRILGKIRTIYTPDGRPTQNRPSAKGWHQVAGTAKLNAGRATVSLNTSVSQGRQDVSFQDSVSYRGFAWVLDTLNRNVYRVIPLSGKQFIIMSSDSTDAANVLYRVEGE